MINILFTNTGRRTYLIEYAFNIIDNYNYDMKIYVSDASEDTASFWVDKRISKLLTPYVSKNEERYINELLGNCQKHDIDIVIPLMDFELLALAKNINEFEKINTKVIVSNYNLVKALLNKSETSLLCKKINVNYPKIWESIKDFDGKFPVIKKEIKGSGSKGLQIIRSRNELNTLDRSFNKKYILQEYIKGQEYGADIFNDLNGNYLHCCVKKKILMRSGETDKARTVNSVKYNKICRKIGESLGHIGNIDADFIEKENGEIFFIDFNPRFGGGYPFSHSAGCNYLKAVIDMVNGEIPKIPSKINKIVGAKGIKIFISKEDL